MVLTAVIVVSTLPYTASAQTPAVTFAALPEVPT